MRAKHCSLIIGRSRVLFVLTACMLVLASCSSTSSPGDYAVGAYPSQSIIELFKDSPNSAASARPVGPPAPADSSTMSAATPVTGSAPEPAASALATRAAPTAAAPANDFDPAASAYPSVSLFDFSSKSTKSSPESPPMSSSK